MREFKAETINNHLLLRRKKGVVEQTRLSKVVREGRARFTDKVATVVTGGRSEETIPNGLVGLHWGAGVQGVGGVCPLVGGDGILHKTITVVVMNRNNWAVDRELLEVR
jgi:hypothetical protein